LLIRPSYNLGFARSAGESKHPTLWQGLVRRWLMNAGGGRIHDLVTKTTYPLNTNTAWTLLGGYGACLDFTATADALIEYGGSSSSYGQVFPTGAYTIIALVRQDTASGWNNITGGFGTDHTFWIPSSWGTATAQLASGHNGSWDAVVDPTTFTINKWTWVGVTFDPAVGSGTMKLFREGRLVDSATSIPTHNTATYTYVGGYAGGNSFQGQIADMSIYSKALTEKEMLNYVVNPYAMIELSEGVRDYVAAASPGGNPWYAYAQQ